MRSTPQQTFEAWAPAGALWSDWAKPVLFAHVSRLSVIDPPPGETREVGALPPAETPDVSALPPADGSTALVIDLPAQSGVHFAMAAAQLGYRPVPLYNAVPAIAASGYGRYTTPGERVAVTPILRALMTYAEPLRALRLSAGAPPAFLLDANRRLGSAAPLQDDFDNRSISFPTDFPSADRLRGAGVSRMLLVQTTIAAPQPDLAHTLRRWQEAGLALDAAAADALGTRVACDVARPSRFRSIWHALLVTAGLHRHPLGGFGGLLNEYGTSGGFWASG